MQRGEKLGETKWRDHMAYGADYKNKRAGGRIVMEQEMHENRSYEDTEVMEGQISQM